MQSTRKQVRRPGAVDTVRKEEKGGSAMRKDGRGGKVSLAFLKAERRGKAVKEWREEILRRCRGSRAFRVPTEGETPRIPLGLSKIPKEVASRFFQLISGHALTASFTKEKFGWLDSDTCWCGSARQTRKHLFKERVAWKEEIKELWKNVGEASGLAEKRECTMAGVYKGRKEGFFLGGCRRKDRAVRRPGNTSIRDLMSDGRSTEFIVFSESR